MTSPAVAAPPRATSRSRLWRNAASTTAAAVCLGVGVGLGAIFDEVVWPWALGSSFWVEFWTGPPVAGLFAVMAATIAFFPAYQSTLIARESAAREQWWNRAQWALELTVSGDSKNRTLAATALAALDREATPLEASLLAEFLVATQLGVDAGEEIPDTGMIYEGLWMP